MVRAGHEEFNGGDIAMENRPDIVARSGETGPGLRYFLLNPAVVYQGDTDGAHGLWLPFKGSIFVQPA